jgi:hypothetical protein
MSKKKKIGILTYHFIRNYGAVIQACCLAKFIQSEGHECVILDYRPQHRIAFKQKIKNTIKSVGGLREIPRSSIHSPVMLDYIKSSQLLGDRVCATVSELEESVQELDGVIFGSDEIWNFENIFGYLPAYMGGFQFDGAKISYAPSFGNYAPSGFKKKSVERLLGDFKSISVRDDHSKEVVNTLLAKTPSLVPDPTFLMDLSYASMPQKGFILVTGHLSPLQSLSVIEFAKRVKLPVISVGHRCQGIECIDANATPDVWLAYLRAASFVVSTLFHASILALKYGVPFAVFNSPEKRLKLRSMVKKFDLEHTLLPEDANADLIQNSYERRKEVPDSLVETFRMEGVNYLRSAINS